MNKALTAKGVRVRLYKYTRNGDEEIIIFPFDPSKVSDMKGDKDEERPSNNS